VGDCSELDAYELGTALITLIGIVVLGEPAAALKLAGTALIVVGVVTLNLSGGTH
jgi:small multidrug resistance pump